MLGGPATIFAYCERDSDPAFWAEPLNAVTNAGFLAAALAGAIMLARRRGESWPAWQSFFILNLAAIGVGSFLFHTRPNSATVLADTVPIGVFMLAYLAFAVRRFMGASWPATIAAEASFLALIAAAFRARALDASLGLNGSIGYLPALFAMLAVGVWLARRRHPAASFVLAAGVTFAVSLTLRSIDRAVCDETVAFGHRAGTHFLWHILNSVTLFLLVAASIRHGAVASQVLPPRPRPGQSSYSTR